MTSKSILPEPCWFSISLERYPGGLLVASLNAGLPGVERYQRSYRADDQAPEECCSWHDDVANEIKTWGGLVRCVVEDWSFCHTPALF